jgi:protein-S-isoprenylcysteine O-methyltransferase Ste14
MLTAARVVVVLSWIVVFIGWVRQWLRARAGRSEWGRRVNPVSLIGMTLELGSFIFPLIFLAPELSVPPWLCVFAALLAVASAALGWAAGEHLGAQLRIQAVVTDTHRLITSGPYSVVRHPIYACLFGFLISTGLVFSRPIALLIAIPILVIGTEIRMRAEDKLLETRFGEEFEAYRRRVSAWLPGIR